jgi:hypothetical protein
MSRAPDPQPQTRIATNAASLPEEAASSPRDSQI